MKVLVTLSLCGLAAIVCVASGAQSEVLLSSAFEPKCPPGNGENVELISNPDNCTTYYACNYGVAIPMRCPPDLHFNDKLKVCDLPEAACCDPAFDPENKCNKLA